MAFDKERDELLQRFINVIGEPAGSTFFDEDELVELFDYAGDLNDDFIKMEILWWGARLYPDSIALAERKGFMYLELGNEMAAKKVVKRVPETSALRRLLTLRIEHPSQEVAMKEMENILDVIDDFKDEEIIKFVQTGGDTGLYDWLKNNKERIQKKCSFPQSFLYEMIGVAEENSDFDFIIQLLEELTEIEPFNSEFWEMMADYYNFHFNDPEKTLNAAEYALAIDPDSPKSIMLRAKALYDLKHPVSEIEPSIISLMEKLPDDKAPVQVLAMMWMEQEEDEMAVELLANYLDKHPGDRMMLSSLILYSAGDVDPKYFKAYYEDQHPESSLIVDWAKESLEVNHASAALSLLDLIPEEDRDSDYNSVLAEALFAERKYKEIVELFERLTDDRENRYQYLTPRLVAIRTISSCGVRMTQSRRAKLLAFIHFCIVRFSNIRKWETNPTITTLLEAEGVLHILHSIGAQLLDNKKVNPDQYNNYVKKE